MSLKQTTSRAQARGGTAPAAADMYVTRHVALDILGIKPQTLYAYVSRGWIRSVRQPGGGKVSLYAREDVDKVKARATARTGHGVAAAGAMRWGEPIIPTSITEIASIGHRYRGRDALALVREGAQFEAVADLLWTGLWLEATASWPVHAVPPVIARVTRSLPSEVAQESINELFTLFAIHLGLTRGSVAQRLRGAAPVDAARQLLQVMTGCLGLLAPRAAFEPMKEGERISSAVLRVLQAQDTPLNRKAVEAILVLLADHELTSSTFAARVAASSGALLHGCVAAALATNSGVEIGRLYDRVEQFAAPSLDADALLQAARAFQQRGATPPGFNHPLYPRGDPRADHLLALARERPNKPARLRRMLEFLEAAERKMQLHARVEFGVVALCVAMRLPQRSAGALFTLARTAGWVAHVLEQRTAGFLLRPRAKYVPQEGPPGNSY